MRVSRRFYEEILPVLWGRNTFAFSKPFNFTEFIEEWT
jgi:hypothetical protein